MSDHFEQTIAEMQKTLADQEAEVLKTKEMINRIREYAGKPPLYSDAELRTSSQIGITRSDQFYGKPLAGSARSILEMRDASGAGPAAVRQLYESLIEGGYHFDTKSEANSIRSLRVSLSKNIAVFHKLPNGEFGLRVWYGNKVNLPKAKDTTQPTEAEPSEDGNGGDDDFADLVE